MGLTVDKVSTNKATTSNQRVYIVRKNDSLWNIAKRELGKKASNQQIADLTNAIAKLNKFDTEQKRNNIKVNAKIYLPSEAKHQDTMLNRPKPRKVPHYEWGSDDFKPKKVQNKPVPATPQKTQPPKKVAAPKTKPVQVKTKPAPVKQHATVPQAKSNALKGFDKVYTNIFNKDMRVEKAFFVPAIKTKLYHIYTTSADGRMHLRGSCEKDQNGKIKLISFNGENKINSFGYDYVLLANGNIYKKTDLDYYSDSNNIPVQDKVPEATMQKMKAQLEKICK